MFVLLLLAHKHNIFGYCIHILFTETNFLINFLNMYLSMYIFSIKFRNLCRKNWSKFKFLIEWFIKTTFWYMITVSWWWWQYRDSPYKLLVHETSGETTPQPNGYRWSSTQTYILETVRLQCSLLLRQIKSNLTNSLLYLPL